MPFTVTPLLQVALPKSDFLFITICIKILEKSISSHTAQVMEHADKIAHPENYDIGWGEKDERQREGLLKKWEKDLKRNAEQAEIEIEVWKERFGNEP